MADAIDLSAYLEEYREHGEILISGQWAMEGAESLEEAADMLRAFADELEALSSAGFHLMSEIEDDLGFAHRSPETDRGSRPVGHGAQHHLNEEPAPIEES